VKQAGTSILVAAATALILPAPHALASPSWSLSEPQRVVAETWRAVDKGFVDRTFNGREDWFQLRQEAVRKKYSQGDAGMQEAYSEAAGLVATLGDPYTRFLGPSKFATVVNSATASVGGVGVEILEDVDGSLRVGDVQPSSPASAVGLMKGDTFVLVDGVSCQANKAQSREEGGGEDRISTVDEVAALLRGPPGSAVGITVSRAAAAGGGGGSELLDFKVKRATFKIQTVTSSQASQRVQIDLPTDTAAAKKAATAKRSVSLGVVRIKGFSTTTAEDVQTATLSLLQQGRTDGIVLDLRNNAGGLLGGGIDTASLFLPKDSTVVTVTDAKGQTVTSTVTDTGNAEVKRVPLLVLVNRKTASAAEVLTASLQDNGRALVVGETSFGKGVVQNVASIRSGTAGVAVTVAKYATPNGRSINKIGIIPDIQLPSCSPLDDVSECLKSVSTVATRSQPEANALSQLFDP